MSDKGRMKKILEDCSRRQETNGTKKNKLAHTVLVVDDALFMRSHLTSILTAVGYRVVGEAANGKEAIEKFLEVRPTVVTMDVTMPEMDGIEAVRRILEMDNTATIVMVSAMGYKDMVVDALVAGAKNFVIKPVTTRNLKRFLTVIKMAAGEA